MKKLFVLMLTILTLIPMLFSCGDKVVINTNGGALDSTYVENADFADIIASIPTKEGYIFAGWYSDAAFTDYIDPKRITSEQEEANRAFAKWITVPESRTYSLRSDEATITDSGRANQKMDTVMLSQDYNVTDLMRAGYTSLKVTVMLTVCEADDGYQYVFLYKDENCVQPTDNLLDLASKYILGEEEEDPSLLYTHKFEHDPDGVDIEWKTYEFETVVSLSAMKENLYVRYGASGNGEDTWKNKDIAVTVTPIK